MVASLLKKTWLVALAYVVVRVLALSRFGSTLGLLSNAVFDAALLGYLFRKQEGRESPARQEGVAPPINAWPGFGRTAVIFLLAALLYEMLAGTLSGLLAGSLYLREVCYCLLQGLCWLLAIYVAARWVEKAPRKRPAGRVMLACAVVIVVYTVATMLLLWPYLAQLTRLAGVDALSGPPPISRLAVVLEPLAVYTLSLLLVCHLGDAWMLGKQAPEQ